MSLKNSSDTIRNRTRDLDLSVDGRIMVRWMFRKWDVGLWTGSNWFRVGTGGRHL